MELFMIDCFWSILYYKILTIFVGLNFIIKYQYKLKNYKVINKIREQS
jgi:hypothetical protein